MSKESKRPGRKTDKRMKELNNTNNKSFRFLLEQLSLNPKEKIGVKKFLTVDTATFSDEALTSSEEIPDYILHKLMIVDYRARTFKLQEPRLEQFSDNEDDDKQEDNEDSQGGGSEGQVLINPMDAFLALFYCCDDFLRQDLAIKLTACQLSIPFLLPNPDKPCEDITMLLWVLRGIKKSWKKIENGNELDCQAFVTKCPFPIVSFVRLGEVNMSKSRLLNEVISDINGYRDFFFHKDCEGGGVERKFVDGLVELCWYLPGGRQKQAFEREICFANLRGDAKMFEKQFSILLNISSVLVLLLSSKNLDAEMKEILTRTMIGKGKVLLVFQEKREEKVKEYYDELKKMNKDKCSIIIKAMKTNQDDFIKAIQGKVRQFTKDTKSPLLKDLTNLGYSGVVLDESTIDICTCTSFYGNIANWFQKDPKRAKTLLKLQSMVPTIADLERENFRPTRRGDKSEEEYSNEIQNKLQAAKKFQKDLLKAINRDVCMCLTHIPVMSKKGQNYCLTVLKQELDNMSLEILAPLQSAYRKEWLDVVKDKKNTRGDEKAYPNSGEERLLELEKVIIESSFGLEHIFREMAQIVLLTDTSFVDYTGAAAQVLLSGRPLELMDGDSSYIPLKWFNEVFNKLKSLTKDAKIFVISVLGIQSSGKSTMLNTMFGLEFPVSAGRCTRGAFASLIPLSDSLRHETKYDYLLIVDTEGLKGSTEPHLRQHDNELATFAIGVADLTIVNVFGENYNEMKEFLEIAVHAFLKMKLVNEKRTCQIVHQNVAALDASHELAMERTTLRKKLDEMTKLAAIQENCETEFKELNDVIAFNENKDVSYIPCMLQGCPPMAPVNPEYGKAVQKVKEKILEIMFSSDRLPLSVSQFQKRVVDLWDAIRRENFIFSFRNTIEVRAYTSLDGKFFQLSLNTIIAMAEQEKRTLVSLKRSPPAIREYVWRTEKVKIRETAEEQVKIVEKEMESFFETNQDKHTLEQWRSNTMNRIKQLKDSQQDEVINSCQIVFRYLQSRQEIDEKKSCYKDKLLTSAKEFITSVETTDDVDVCKGKFEQAWHVWLEDEPDCGVRKIDVGTEMINLLLECSKRFSGIIQEKCHRQKFKIKEFGKSFPVIKGNLEMMGTWKKFKNFWWEDPQLVHNAERICDKAIDAALGFANEVLRSSERCRKSDLTRMYQIICQALTKGTKGQPFKFGDNVFGDVLLHGFAKACPIFEEMEDRYFKEHDIKLHFETNLKPDLQKYFLNQCQKIKKEDAAATLFVDVLKKPIQSEINQCMGLAVARELLNINEFQSKGQFHAAVLIKLGKANSFSNYVPYLQNPVKFLKNTLRESIETQMVTNPLVVTSLERVVEKTKTNIFNVIASTTAEVLSERKGIYGWIKMFVNNCSTLAITQGTFSVVTIDEDLKDFNVFESQVVKKLNVVFQEILTRGVDRQVCQEWQPQPYDKLVDIMFGCEECCPFCRALCDQTTKNHDCAHSTRNHRPQGIGGYRNVYSGILHTSVCTTDVAGEGTFKNIDTKDEFHPYKDYQTVNDYYKSWSIAPDLSFEASHYWKWFMAKYSDELAAHYEANLPKIPSSWKKITFEETKPKLLNDYNLS